MGNRAMCKCIIEVDESLVDQRNEDSHTPLFLTALHGKKEAFVFLLKICEQQEITRYYRGKSGEPFSTAPLMENTSLVAYMNERGMSPFHLLASITVKMLLPEQDQIMNQIGQESRNIEAPSVQQFPSNYSTCCDFLNRIYHVLLVFYGWVVHLVLCSGAATAASFLLVVGHLPLGCGASSTSSLGSASCSTSSSRLCFFFFNDNNDNYNNF
ncbi:hypothetical protein CK203_061957 [Vitis vinifera]|uniref:Uncharacterized protein n=1 Tax=Vitis vinifera TaxID=29760 RepID=A0A438GF19_VITVI|nr:hypothetical protein CK203_061957 [Vitis vinifera]